MKVEERLGDGPKLEEVKETGLLNTTCDLGLDPEPEKGD